MAAELPANPYVGPRPFEREDAVRFFGRAREVRDVVSLVVAQRVLLLYSASGAGKSSLLRAGVLPVLEEEKGFDVLPVARLHAEEASTDRNVFLAGVVSSLDGSGVRLEEVLEARPRASGTRLRALVIDQFEELFTLYPGRWQEQPELFGQLAGALARDSDLRLVLAIREDFLAQLDPFANMLPGGLRTRFRLERLDRTSALAAVEGPLAKTRRSFAPGAAEALVDDLLRFRVDTGRGLTQEVEGQYVEPVQLQVACRTLWTDLPADVAEITEDHLRTYADVEQVLTRFYDDAMVAASNHRPRRERRVRDWVGRVLITPGGTRGAAYAAADGTAGLSNEIVRVLEEKRVIRAEWRAGARWYELTHDRLIDPIRASNERYSARRRKRLLIEGAGGLALLLAGVGVAVGFFVGSSGPSVYEGQAAMSGLRVQPRRGSVLVTFDLRSGGLISRGLDVYAGVMADPHRSPGARHVFVDTHENHGARSVRMALEAPKRRDVAFTVHIVVLDNDIIGLLKVRSTRFAYAASGDPCTIVGSERPDILRGTQAADVVCGLGGPDVLSGLSGDDELDGGRGNDQVAGGPGDDTIAAGPGSDAIVAGTGRDRIRAGPGDDSIFAKDGQKDVIDGGPGDDLYLVDEGLDVVRNVEHQTR